MGDNRIPAVDRAFDVLDSLARSSSGGSITSVSEQLRIPRSTVYRILNSLEARGIVLRDAQGSYALGPQLIRLASAVSKGMDVVTLARPFMERLAAEQVVTVKLSTLDQGTALVVAVVESPKTYSVTTKVGSRFPLHAGAASKVLLAHADEETQRDFFATPLESVTSDTVADVETLRGLLPMVRQQGWSEDHGEFVVGINAVAAPVFGPNGRCICALSVPYVSTTDEQTSLRLREAVVATAHQMTHQLGGLTP